MSPSETAAATLAAEARVREAVKTDPVDVQLNAFLVAYLNLVSAHGLRHEAGESLLQIGAAILWSDATEPICTSAFLH